MVNWPSHLWYRTACSKGTSINLKMGEPLVTGMKRRFIMNGNVLPNISAVFSTFSCHLYIYICQGSTQTWNENFCSNVHISSALNNNIIRISNPANQTKFSYHNPQCLRFLHKPQCYESAGFFLGKTPNNFLDVRARYSQSSTTAKFFWWQKLLKSYLFTPDWGSVALIVSSPGTM